MIVHTYITNWICHKKLLEVECNFSNGMSVQAPLDPNLKKKSNFCFMEMIIFIEQVHVIDIFQVPVFCGNFMDVHSWGNRDEASAALVDPPYSPFL